MASNYTSHYHLNQWDGADKVQRVDFNADNAAIDAALAAQAAELEATQSKLDTAKSELADKITQLDRDTDTQTTALSSSISALQTKLAALQKQLDSHPTYKIGVLSGYDGTEDVSINLGKQPKMVMVGNRLGWNNIITSSSSTSRPGHAVAMPNYPGYLAGMSSDAGVTAILTVTSTGFTLGKGLYSTFVPYYYLALL